MRVRWLALTERLRRDKRPFAAISPFTRGRFAARADVACKGALPVAEKATTAVGQPLALSAATRAGKA